jgi:hypothetical protein
VCRVSRCIVVMQDPWVVGRKFGSFLSNFFTLSFQYFQIVNVIKPYWSFCPLLPRQAHGGEFANFIVSSRILEPRVNTTWGRALPWGQVTKFIWLCDLVHYTFLKSTSIRSLCLSERKKTFIRCESNYIKSYWFVKIVREFNYIWIPVPVLE